MANALRLVAEDGTRVSVWHDLGVLYQQRGALAESRGAFERALELNPKLASAHNNLGNTLARLGLYDEAVARFRAALAVEPTLTAAHSNAASALYSLGRYDDALVHARGAVAIDPSQSDPRVSLGFVLAAAHGPQAGLDEIAALLRRDPTHIGALAARAHLLVRMERFGEALDAANAGLALAPDHALLLESRGGALRALGQTNAAIGSYDRAAGATPDRPETLVLKASAQLEAGAFDEARLTLESAITLAPENALAWHTLSEIRPFTANDPAIAAMEKLLAESPRLREPEQRTLMHFALGRVYHKIHEHDRAFRQFAYGNSLKRASIAYDVATDERFAHDSIGTYTAGLMQAGRGHGETSRAPIFIVGMPRSGTTLVESILAAHPDVYGAGELTLFDRAIAERGRGDVRALGRHYLMLLDQVAPANKRVVDKLPSNFRHVGLIHLALPNARIIHCTRDVLDTSFSCFSTLFTGRQDFAYDQVEIARFFRAYAALMAHWHAVLPPGVILDVSYEYMVERLDEGARRILAFCKLPWNEAVLRFYETTRPIRTASYYQARRPVYASSVGSAIPYRWYLGPLIDALAR